MVHLRQLPQREVTGASLKCDLTRKDYVTAPGDRTYQFDSIAYPQKPSDTVAKLLTRSVWAEREV